MLGPPKTAFASAAGRGNGNKTFDTPPRSSFTNHEDAGTKNDRTNFRDRYSRDGQRPERDGDKGRDPRPASTQNRRSVKDDSDLWSNVRQARTPGQEEGERPYRKNGDRDYDRDREGGREPRTQRGFDNHRRDGDRDAEGENGARRVGLGRGRNEPSWYKDEGHKEEGGHEDSGNTRPWDRERRGTRGQDRDWNRGGMKVEMEPEWMDAPGPEEQSHVKTSEDFERWKKQMKTGSTATQDTPLPPTEQRSNHQPTASGGVAGAGRGKVDTPLVIDSSFDDGFFGLWTGPKKSKDVTDNAENGAPPMIASTGAKSSKPSKFTGFFNPRPDPEPLQEQPSIPSMGLFAPPQDSSNEDKEGFQRILNLLGQQQPQNGTTTTPPRAQTQRGPPASPPVQSPQGREQNVLFSLVKTGSPQGNAVPQTRDSEFLLKLMQQPQQGRHDLRDPNLNGRRAGQDTTPGLLPFSNLMISPNETPQPTSSVAPPPGFYDDGHTRDKLNPGAERRGPPPGFFDASKPQRPSPVGAPQSSGLPPGIQRPPGLEQIPPGYAQHIQPQRQTVVPPPGFQVPSRGHNAFPPGLFANNNPNQFGVPTNGRGMPPPGFVNAPPPGFPLPFSQEGLPFGAFGDGNFGQGGFEQQRRQ